MDELDLPNQLPFCQDSQPSFFRRFMLYRTSLLLLQLSSNFGGMLQSIFLFHCIFYMDFLFYLFLCHHIYSKKYFHLPEFIPQFSQVRLFSNVLLEKLLHWIFGFLYFQFRLFHHNMLPWILYIFKNPYPLYQLWHLVIFQQSRLLFHSQSY